MVVCLLVGLVATTLATGPGWAQSSLSELKAERAQAQREAAAKAAQIDVANAEVDDLTAALQALRVQVNAAQGRLEEAQRNLAEAEARLAAAQIAIDEQRAEISRLGSQLSDRAISSFVNQGNETNVLLEQADPNEAVRMQTLVQNVSQSEADLIEAMRTAEEDLAVQEALAADAAEEAAIHQSEVEVELAAVTDAKDTQARITAEAEARLEARLAEAAALEQLEANLSREISAEEQRLAEELARRRAAEAAAESARASSGGGSTPNIVGEGEIVSVRGIRVHNSISGKVDSMLGAAAAAGINLSGGGYRSAEAQIQTRRNNCGTSNYAIYQMPSSQCRPPTARPGSSQHERGLAIDFTYNGSLIRSRNNAGYRWLAANAASYGFYNLPSEPWHWSTTGR